ncbi:DUF1345 domain-containing protein [Kineosporia sp. NBRC 101731]|uniref:DUF1345 domain-containing protein n=1 Tax=Kineosporia sp. NBRC 101731 TaxID=3032199 RepID=UPI002552DDA5|nr:DUF1345 domain-containing protein [Kineosporia sp. NBRC 101731]
MASRPVAHRAPWPSRLLDVVLLLSTLATCLAVLWGGADSDSNDELSNGSLLLFLLATQWILIGLLWTLVRVRRIRQARKGDTRWSSRLAGGRATRMIVALTAVIVIDSGFNIAFWRGDDLNAVVIRFTSMAMVLVAWTILQLAYAERYARLDLENTAQPAHLEFPATAQPTLLEYAYFSFTVGSTFGTSDVSVQTSRMRGIVLCHGLLSFVYNTAVLGMVLSLISG